MRNPPSVSTVRLVGSTALAFTALYLASDIVEAVQGGFSDGQLWMTSVAEAAIPAFVVGLCLAQQPQLGRSGEVGAAAYAYSYVFFTGTVVYAPVNGTGDLGALSHDLRPWMLIHGAIMVVAGICFGAAVVRAGVLPRWTGVALAAGVVLVAFSQGPPTGMQVIAAGSRDSGLAGMGAGLLLPDTRSRWSSVMHASRTR
jgi:hypothetical protein